MEKRREGGKKERGWEEGEQPFSLSPGLVRVARGSGEKAHRSPPPVGSPP